MDKEQLKQIVIEQRETLFHKPLGIEREQLKNIEKKIPLPHIIVITGMRRCGKSTLLRQIMNKYYADKHFYYINFEDERLFQFKATEFNQLYEALLEVYGEQKTFFIDEIQAVDMFELFVRRFYDSGFKFFITGSNAKLLSHEVSTKLTGRHVDIIVKPFSFEEFLKLNNLIVDNKMLYQSKTRVMLKNYFSEYLETGGMPEFLVYNDSEILLRTYEDIVLKDIIVRHNVENNVQIRELYTYLINNFSNKFSYTKLKEVMKLGSVNTIKKYITYLEDSYFVKTIHKFEYSFRKQLVNDKKVYVNDNGFIQKLATRITKDKGWLLENLVFNTLNISSPICYFSQKRECDFIVMNNKEIVSIIQVTYVLDLNNKEREIEGLIEALEYTRKKEGLIITYDQEEVLKIKNKTIKIIPIWKWLLK